MSFTFKANGCENDLDLLIFFQITICLLHLDGTPICPLNRLFSFKDRHL